MSMFRGFSGHYFFFFFKKYTLSILKFDKQINVFMSISLNLILEIPLVLTSLRIIVSLFEYTNVKFAVMLSLDHIIASFAKQQNMFLFSGSFKACFHSLLMTTLSFLFS